MLAITESFLSIVIHVKNLVSYEMHNQHHVDCITETLVTFYRKVKTQILGILSLLWFDHMLVSVLERNNRHSLKTALLFDSYSGYHIVSCAILCRG